MIPAPHLVVPAAAGAVYAVAAVLLHRAIAGGLGPWRVTFVANLVMGGGFAVLLLFHAPDGGDFTWWKPSVCGALFFLGQIFTFRSLTGGEVAVATPVLGTKVLLVAVFTAWILGQSVPPMLWAAALLASGAIALLRDGAPSRRDLFLPTVANAGTASAAFALVDVALQAWAPEAGFTRFVPAMFAVNAALSLLLIPGFKGPVWPPPKGTSRWLVPGALLLAGQSLAMAFSVAVYQQATATNVAYTSRAVWGVLFAWAATRGACENERPGKRVMIRRLMASFLVLAAIYLATRG